MAAAPSAARFAGEKYASLWESTPLAAISRLHARAMALMSLRIWNGGNPWSSRSLFISARRTSFSCVASRATAATGTGEGGTIVVADVGTVVVVVARTVVVVVGQMIGV